MGCVQVTFQSRTVLCPVVYFMSGILFRIRRIFRRSVLLERSIMSHVDSKFPSVIPHTRVQPCHESLD